YPSDRKRDDFDAEADLGRIGHRVSRAADCDGKDLQPKLPGDPPPHGGKHLVLGHDLRLDDGTVLRGAPLRAERVANVAAHTPSALPSFAKRKRPPRATGG